MHWDIFDKKENRIDPHESGNSVRDILDSPLCVITWLCISTCLITWLCIFSITRVSRGRRFTPRDSKTRLRSSVSYNHGFIRTDRKRSCGKVMFFTPACQSFCSQGRCLPLVRGRCLSHPHTPGQTPLTLGRHLPIRHPPARHPLARHPPVRHPQADTP